MARDPQIAFDLDDTPVGARDGNPPLRASLTGADPLPQGPYSVGLTYWWGGDGIAHEGRPYTIRCGDGRCVAGHVESLDCATAIAAAMNAQYPVAA